jgi:predicted alpha/beta hydrolase family esterase
VRVLIVPGLHDSGLAHWQSWLEGQFPHTARVKQRDFGTPDLDAWAERIGDTLAAHGRGPWVAVAHSFGCLALAHHLAQSVAAAGAHDSPLPAAALLVAPADPRKFNVAHRLPTQPLPLLSALVASDTDPWMQAADARAWAARWGSHFINLGDRGHINAEAGFGPFPQAKHLVQLMIHQIERGRRWERAHPLELSFAV